ncbi:MAG: DUF3443 family protein, partial [Steroidobacteraceae bacterium]
MSAVVDSTLAGANGPDNFLYVSVTVCQPGTQTCATVDDVQVSTATSGLRILASALPAGFTLTPEPDPAASGNTLAECYQLPQGTAWGNVATADVQIGGETASSVPIQIVSNPAANPAATCADNGWLTTVGALSANGVLGIGPLAQDCTGAGCTNQYFTCQTTAGGVVNCQQNVSAAPGTTAEVTNPVTLFATDKNGVIITLPTVDPNAGAASGLAGTITFGIGTQADNAYNGAATAYSADPGTGAVTTSYASVTTGSTAVNYTSWFDTGSDAFFFPDSGITTCPETAVKEFYCPAQPLSLTASVSGAGSPAGGSPPAVNFTVVSADTLNATPSAAFSSLAANSPPNPDFGSFGAGMSFIWGIPFFYGKTVFIAYPGASIAGDGGAMLTGPFYA